MCYSTFPVLHLGLLALKLTSRFNGQANEKVVGLFDIWPLAFCLSDKQLFNLV